MSLMLTHSHRRGNIYLEQEGVHESLFIVVSEAGDLLCLESSQYTFHTPHSDVCNANHKSSVLYCLRPSVDLQF